jgi:hypothetical protein
MINPELLLKKKKTKDLDKNKSKIEYDFYDPNN